MSQGDYMPGLMQPDKKNDVQLILGKLKGASTSENSSEAIKTENEKSVELLTQDDQVDSSTAQEAAASSLMAAITAQDPKMMASAIMDLMRLLDLEEDKLEDE